MLLKTPRTCVLVLAPCHELQLGSEQHLVRDQRGSKASSRDSAYQLWEFPASTKFSFFFFPTFLPSSKSCPVQCQTPNTSNCCVFAILSSFEISRPPPSIQILEYHMARLLCIFDVFNSVHGARTQGGPKIESMVALDLKYNTCRNHNAPLDVSLFSEYILEEHLLNQLINLIEYYLDF